MKVLVPPAPNALPPPPKAEGVVDELPNAPPDPNADGLLAPPKADDEPNAFVDDAGGNALVEGDAPNGLLLLLGKAEAGVVVVF